MPKSDIWTNVRMESKPGTSLCLISTLCVFDPRILFRPARTNNKVFGTM